MASSTPKPIFFTSAADFGRWLTEHHSTAREVWVGFHKVVTGRPSLTWPQSVAEALCVGWIDGVRKRVDDHRYVIRFTPRKPGSTWSAVNIKTMTDLIRQGRALPAGIEVFAARSDRKSGIYSYEQRASAKFDRKAEQQFRTDLAAWTYFQSRPPWYRRTATYWVMTAKREQTRQRRLGQLIEACARGELVGPLRRPGKG